jgi:hypothetical protein
MMNTIDNFSNQLQANIIAHFSSDTEAEQAVLGLKKLVLIPTNFQW